MFKRLFFTVVAALAVILTSCSEGGGVNMFTLEDDKALGAQIAAEIAAAPDSFPVLDSVAYPKAYALVYAIRDRILASGKVTHKDDFIWQVRIINNDDVVNAFCTPGGYIYVYTGLIRYLDNEAQLAGVIGHEMAHADLRHSTDQLTEAYGISALVSLLLGDNVLGDIAVGLTQLAFSRGDESQADAYSVTYLCPTEYAASGSAGFFEKIEAEGGVDVPEFLSTHPSPSNRINDIYAKTEELTCAGGALHADRYDALINALPKK
jgi:beta-barrel assembly-enhancing protease